MFITIEILAGKNGDEPTKEDMNKNINALNRAISKSSVSDENLLISTRRNKRKTFI